MEELQQHNALVTVVKNGMTIGGAVRREGEVFAASDLPVGVWELIKAGYVDGVTAQAGLDQTNQRVQLPPVAVAVDFSGQPIKIPADRHGFRGVEIEVHPREGMVRTAYAADELDRAAAERIGIDPVEGAYELEAHRVAVEATKGERHDLMTDAGIHEQRATARLDEMKLAESMNDRRAELDAELRLKQAEAHGLDLKEVQESQADPAHAESEHQPSGDVSTDVVDTSARKSRKA